MPKQISIDYIKEIKKLPAMPVVATKTMNLLEEREPDMEAIQKTITQDPNLSTSILRFANSPFYGFRGEIVNIKEACIVLGFKAVQKLVRTSVALALVKGVAKPSTKVTNMHTHSLAVAALSESLVVKSQLNQDEAFLGGLLHDIGKLLIYNLDTKQDSVLDLDIVIVSDRDLEQEEMEQFSVNHYTIGAMMAEHWNFPQNIQDAIKNHHKIIDDSGSASLSDLVYLADNLAIAMFYGLSKNQVFDEFNEAVVPKLGLSWKDVQQALLTTEQKMAESEYLFH